jgi:hypothetical protein
VEVATLDTNKEVQCGNYLTGTPLLHLWTQFRCEPSYFFTSIYFLEEYSDTYTTAEKKWFQCFSSILFFPVIPMLPVCFDSRFSWCLRVCMSVVPLLIMH